MYVEKTTAAERLTIDNTVGSLFAIFGTCNRLLLDITDSGFKCKNGM